MLKCQLKNMGFSDFIVKQHTRPRITKYLLSNKTKQMGLQKNEGGRFLCQDETNANQR